MFSRQISWKSLATVCRALSTMLFSGIAIAKVFDLATRKTSDRKAKQALDEISLEIRQGSDVSSAMRRTGAFPDLMCDMVDVSEKTGALPEVLESLAEHYENNVRLKRSFHSAIAWPMFQLIMAILVIGAMIYVLGIIAGGGTGFDPLGFGLTGTSGALLWYTITYGTLVGLFVAQKVISNSVAGRKLFDPLLMRIPALGYCMRSFAIARFSWAFSLTQQTGMAITKSLNASFKATSNGAFLAAAPHAVAAVKAGETLHTALVETQLFPEDYLETIDVAETSGTVPETLKRLSPQFEEQARRALSMLASALAWTIWVIVAVFIIFLVLRIMLTYRDLINEASRAI
jgi:type IV pilus assembly protein PilC